MRRNLLKHSLAFIAATVACISLGVWFMAEWRSGSDFFGLVVPDPAPQYSQESFGTDEFDCDRIESFIPTDFWIPEGREVKRNHASTRDTQCSWDQKFAARSLRFDLEIVEGDSFRSWSERAELSFKSRSDLGGSAAVPGLGDKAAFTTSYTHGLELVILEGNLVITIQANVSKSYESGERLGTHPTLSSASLGRHLTEIAEQYLADIGSENSVALPVRPAGEGETEMLPDLCEQHGVDGFAPAEEAGQDAPFLHWCRFSDQTDNAEVWLTVETYAPLGSDRTGVEQAEWLVNKKLKDSSSERWSLGDAAFFTAAKKVNYRYSFTFVMRIGDTVLAADYVADEDASREVADTAAREAFEQLGERFDELMSGR